MFKRSPESHTPESFWKWFSRNEKKLLNLEGLKFMQTVCPELSKYHDGLAIEIGPADQRPREMIISAEGVPAHVDAVELLADASLAGSNWLITRFRQPKSGYRFQYGQLRVDFEQVQFVARRAETKVDIDVYAHWRSPEDGEQPDGPCFLLLDSSLGEYSVICGIGSIGLYPLEDAPVEAKSWGQLPEEFDRLYSPRDE